MPSTPVVVRLDIFEHGGAEFVNGRPRPGMNELFLEGREERFGDRVVETDPGAPDRWAHAICPAEDAELLRRVFAAAVGVKYHAGWRFAVRDGHTQRIDNQVGAREVAAQQVDQARVEPAGQRGALVGPGVHAPQPGGAHQPVGALVRAHHASAAQLITYSAHPHPPPVRRVDLSDPLGEGGVVQRAGGRWPLAPLVETLPRHVQHATHERDRERLLRGLLRDKREPYWFWLAKKAAAEM